jgi:SAM-dependent methyltransferase
VAGAATSGSNTTASEHAQPVSDRQERYPMTFASADQRELRFEDCYFYHTVEMPDHGVVRGQWDLRAHVDEYLGGYDFGGKRVLEIGPASGFLTFEMERRGADVVAFEVADDIVWDIVPYPAPPTLGHISKIKNSFWFLHRRSHSKARVWYGDSCRIPDAVGTFDVAVMAAVLLHCERPVRVIAECAKRANTLIVTEVHVPEFDRQAVCQLNPTVANKVYDTWWYFSPEFFRQYFSVLGFPHVSVTYHRQFFEADQSTKSFFTVIGSKHANEVPEAAPHSEPHSPYRLVKAALKYFNLELRRVK